MKNNLKCYLKRIINENKLILNNSLYELHINKNVPKVINHITTLDMIINQRISISRFGDGEFNIVFGGSIRFQTYNKQLTERLQDILLSSDTEILIGIPNIFSDLIKFKRKSKIYWRNYLLNNRLRLYNLLDMEKTYYDSMITRPYITSISPFHEIKGYFERFKRVWKNRDIVIVEGEGNCFGKGNDLLDSANKIIRIKAPSKNAYEKYWDILKRIKNNSVDRLILCSLGPTATVLCHDLAKLGYQAIDIGNLNGEYELFKVRAKEKSDLPNALS